MSGCKITACREQATGAITLVGHATQKVTVAVCDNHLHLLQGPTAPMSLGFDAPIDDEGARARRVFREWKRAHPRMGDTL